MNEPFQDPLPTKPAPQAGRIGRNLSLGALAVLGLMIVVQPG